ncbi:hypothetical protein AVEN_29943-1, partial [Araneus ventricosus]
VVRSQPNTCAVGGTPKWSSIPFLRNRRLGAALQLSKSQFRLFCQPRRLNEHNRSKSRHDLSISYVVWVKADQLARQTTYGTIATTCSFMALAISYVVWVKAGQLARQTTCRTIATTCSLMALAMSYVEWVIADQLARQWGVTVSVKQ